MSAGATFEVLVDAAERDQTVYTNPGNCKITLSEPIRLDNVHDKSVWQVALRAVRLSFTQRNFTLANQTNVLSVSVNSGGAYFDITFPDGLYTIAEFNAFLDSEVVSNGGTTQDIVFSGDLTTGGILVTLAATARVDFTPAASGRMWSIWGFNDDSGVIAATTLSPRRGDVMDGLDLLTVHCRELFRGRRSSSSTNLSTATCSFDTVYRHALLNKEETTPLWLTCATQQNVLTELTLLVRDRKGRVVDLGVDGTCVLEVSLRELQFF